MGIKKCKDCGGQVSSSAKRCPHCGKPQGMGSFQQLLLAAVVGIGIAAFWSDAKTPEPSNPEPEPKAEPLTAAEKAKKARESKALTARYACRQAIKRSLHDPDSADWTPGFEWPVSINGDMVTVQPSLRANNAFGGKVFQTLTCVVDSSRSRGQHIVRLE